MKYSHNNEIERIKNQIINKYNPLAQKDLRSAKILFEHGADNEIVCFHCQQAIEKYLKGYLIFVTGELHEGHNLVKLVKKAMVHHDDFHGLIRDVACRKRKMHGVMQDIDRTIQILIPSNSRGLKIKQILI